MARIDTIDAMPLEVASLAKRRFVTPPDVGDPPPAPIPDVRLTVAKASPGVPVAPAADSPLKKKPADLKSGLSRWRERLPSLRTMLMVAGVLSCWPALPSSGCAAGATPPPTTPMCRPPSCRCRPTFRGSSRRSTSAKDRSSRRATSCFRSIRASSGSPSTARTANLAQTALTIESMKANYKTLLSGIAAQEAQVSLDQVAFDRAAALVHDDTVTKATYDEARFTLQGDQSKLDSLRHQAEEQLARLGGNPDIPTTAHPLYLQAKAQVDEAQRQLDHASVRAPFDGVVTQVDALQPGTYLVAQTAALTNTGAVALVSTDQIWVTANMKETDLTYARPGNHVDLSVDTYPGQVWSGTVESISPASGSEFSILPAQNSSGNWVKIVQRIPVRIRIDPGPEDPVLRAGMSVNVDIDTGHRRSLSDLF